MISSRDSPWESSMLWLMPEMATWMMYRGSHRRCFGACVAKVLAIGACNKGHAGREDSLLGTRCAFATWVVLQQGLQHESRCNKVWNKNHVAKRDVQMRGTMARWEAHWTARDLADLCPSRPMHSVSKLKLMQVNCIFCYLQRMFESEKFMCYTSNVL